MGKRAPPAPKRKPPPKCKPPAKPAPTSWDAVGAALGIDIRRLYRLKHEAGAPATPNIEQWRAFMAAHESARAGAPKQRSAAELDREQADLRYARARAATAEREDAIAAGLVVTKDQARDAAALVRDTFIAEVSGIGSAMLALLPRLSKTDKEAVESAFDAAWRAARERIAMGTRRG